MTDEIVALSVKDADGPRSDADEGGGAGRSAPLLFLHGVGNSHRTFGFLDGHAADSDPGHDGHSLGPAPDARVVRVDLRGHGDSPATPGRYALEHHVGDIVATLERIGPAVVVGHSLGAAVAWTLSQRRPDLVVAALLEDPPLRAGSIGETAAAHFRLLRERVAQWQSDHARPEAVAAALAAGPAGVGRADVTAGQVQYDDAITARAWGLLRCDPEVLDAVADGRTLSGLELDTSPSVPVRVLAADPAYGGVLPDVDLERLRATHRDVVVRRVAGAGHSLHDERAHRATWLSEIRALTASAR